jgi:hypothetical protein
MPLLVAGQPRGGRKEELADLGDQVSRPQPFLGRRDAVLGWFSAARQSNSVRR